MAQKTREIVRDTFEIVGSILKLEHEPRIINTARGFSFGIEQPQHIRTILRESQKNHPLVFLLAGLSESGKSTFGNTLLASGIATRLKILRVVGELANEMTFGNVTNPNDPIRILTEIRDTRNDELIKQAGKNIVDRTIQILEGNDTPIATIETVSFPWVVDAFRDHGLVREICIYLDPNRDVRIRRQLLQSVGGNIQTAAQVVDQKDLVKTAAGMLDVKKEKADIVVFNGGSVATYRSFITTMGELARYFTRPYKGTVMEYK